MTIQRAVKSANPESNYTVVDVANNSTVVSAGAAILLGWVVNTALSAHACPIKSGSDTVDTIAASAAAGAYRQLPGVRCHNGITVDPNDSGTGNITVFWLPV